MRTANGVKPLPHKICSFTSSFMDMVCLFSIYIVYFFNIWFGMVQHQKQLGCREGRKLVKICRFYRAKEDNQYNLIKLFELFFSFFQAFEIPLLLFLFHLKNMTVNCASVRLSLLFTS